MSAPLRLPEPARNSQRAIALVRVSKEREGMTSPEVQRHAIEDFAARSGYVVVDWVEGIDESGSRSQSAWWPRLDQSIDRLSAGEFDTILVWKFSRVGRARLRWAVALDRVDAIGGSIVSVTEPIESRTASGRFARGMLGELNAYQADLIGETWREAHARRVRHGLPANGKPRFGYVYTPGAGFTVDPLTGPVLQAAYRRYIAGESVYSLVAWLNAGPTRPVGGYGAKGDGLWSDRTLRRVMDSGFGAGLIRAAGETHPGAHEALIEDGEWAAYLDARARRKTSGRTERSEYMLSGLVRCICGSPMHAGQFGANRTAKYRCKAAHEKRTHAGGYVTASHVEQFVTDWLIERQRKARAAAAEARPAAPRPTAVADPTRALRAEQTRLQSEIDTWSTRAVKLDMPREVYQRNVGPLQERAKAVEEELRSVQVRQANPIILGTVDVVNDWTEHTIAERREMLRAVMLYVEVTPGRPRAGLRVEPRP